jgi:outer membrane lipopolysaccharide assembly protein LptE/RlpB
VRKTAGVLVLILALASAGCGYHSAGHAAKLPPDLKTIAIPAFVNHTHTYRVEQVLTAAVVREFLSRTNYRIANEATDSADATLRGDVLATEFAPLTYDSNTGRVSSALITVTMKVRLVDRKGKVLYENQNYIFREQYQVSREISSFFEEETPALDRLSRDFARTLVSNVLEAF